MALKNKLWIIWQRHKKYFGPYLQAAGLDLSSVSTPGNLFDLLLNEIKINYKCRGLEEFSRDGCRGIEPGDPARSLFYHAFASPHVHFDGLTNEQYPTMAELGLIENCVYGAAHLSLDDLLVRAAGRPLAVVVFAYEYAPAIDTVHRRHADLCFSRTGISRVGNARAHYVGEARGFFPYSGSKGKVHVIPARFGTFVAVQQLGNPNTFGPMRFSRGDEMRKFWVPLHKLFDGTECIKGLNLKLKVNAHHLNEKIRRVHMALQSEYHNTGWTPSQMKRSPFRITEGLAKFSRAEGLVKPIWHDPLIKPARTANGTYVGFRVPRGHKLLQASLWLTELFGAIPRPEFVHIKHAIKKDNNGKQRIVYLPNVDPRDIIEIVKEGKYKAANFIDYTADGWVEATCPALAHMIPHSRAAFSIIAQPDFFPLVRQQDLIEWWERDAPRAIKNSIWADTETRPTPLSGSRLPANITLLEAGFDSTETAMSAIIGMDRKPGRRSKIIRKLPRRESTLSYRATNLFEPGWDSSQDFNRDARRKRGTFHLANYGLGSPYPEDTLICAALGSFWPGAVPDVTRTFALEEYPSVTPIVDDQVGWDGILRPITTGPVAEYPSFAYADYVKSIYKKRFPYETFAEVTLEDYIRRTLASARVFQFLGVTKSKERARYPFLSFRHPTDDEFEKIHACGWHVAQNLTYRIEIARFGSIATKPGRPRITRATLDERRVFYSSEYAFAWEDRGNPCGWSVEEFDRDF